jgi:hypothetical protein
VLADNYTTSTEIKEALGCLNTFTTQDLNSVMKKAESKNPFFIVTELSEDWQSFNEIITAYTPPKRYQATRPLVMLLANWVISRR